MVPGKLGGVHERPIQIRHGIAASVVALAGGQQAGEMFSLVHIRTTRENGEVGGFHRRGVVRRKHADAGARVHQGVILRVFGDHVAIHEQ